MFFNLATLNDKNFPNHYRLGTLVLNTDNGWVLHDLEDAIFVVKGYVESMVLVGDALQNLEDHKELGNFVCFKYSKRTQTISVMTNRWRGMLIWVESGKFISNLYQTNHTIWNDSGLVVDQALVPHETKLDIIGPVMPSSMSRDSVTDKIHEIITDRVHGFLASNRLPLKVFCSGGIDSTLVWSYIKAATNSYKLILENRMQWDYFWCHNRQRIMRQFWGYNQIHHWLEPCVLSSGTPGDEFMMRSPTTVNLWCMYHGLDIFDLIADADLLHHEYFNQDKHRRLFEQQQQDRSLDAVMQLDHSSFVQYLCNINANDCQHWHLGNTLTFTPLRDMRIMKLLLSLDPADLLPQILDSAISRELISRNDKSLLDLLSGKKNTGEYLANLAQLTPR
jgi:hypothetical protein